tara:strand:+ start:212 stop:400 length:189 start_codon:yes stop_codon:yes gene_type:complete
VKKGGITEESIKEKLVIPPREVHSEAFLDSFIYLKETVENTPQRGRRDITWMKPHGKASRLR